METGKMHIVAQYHFLVYNTAHTVSCAIHTAGLQEADPP